MIGGETSSQTIYNWAKLAQMTEELYTTGLVHSEGLLSSHQIHPWGATFLRMDLTTKRIMITGGDGFLGRYVIDELRRVGVERIFVPAHQDYELTQMADVGRAYETGRPDIVLHLAAKVGGIGINREKPGEFFYDNLMMGAQLLEQARLAGVE
jgi:GDP-L-fucose synthase